MADPEFLEALRRGDEAAWRRLMADHGALVLHAARRVGLGGQDAEDVFQTAMLSAFRSIDTLRSGDRLAAWLYRIAQRAAIDRVRSRRSTVDMEDAGVIADSVESADDALARIEEARWLHRAILGIDDRCRALLTALYLEEPRPSYRQIAERLRVAVGSIGPTQARCLAKLAKSLADVSNPGAERSSHSEGDGIDDTPHTERGPKPPGSPAARRSERG
jgi:RNA polymerase sigma factor (sigma-70 family)